MINGYIKLLPSGWADWSSFTTVLPPLPEGLQYIAITRPECECPTTTTAPILGLITFNRPGGSPDIILNDTTSSDGVILNNTDVDLTGVTTNRQYGYGFVSPTSLTINYDYDFATPNRTLDIDLTTNGGVTLPYSSHLLIGTTGSDTHTINFLSGSTDVKIDFNFTEVSTTTSTSTSTSSSTSTSTSTSSTSSSTSTTTSSSTTSTTTTIDPEEKSLTVTFDNTAEEITPLLLENVTVTYNAGGGTLYPGANVDLGVTPFMDQKIQLAIDPAQAVHIVFEVGDIPGINVFIYQSIDGGAGALIDTVPIGASSTFDETYTAPSAILTLVYTIAFELI